jgi:cytochrome c
MRKVSPFPLALCIAPLCAALAADPTNTQSGKRLFVNCESCHTLEEDGDSGIGPNLWGIFGSRAAARTDFAYSAALKASGIVWNQQSLDCWLTGPAALVPGTTMGFAGLPDADDRKALIGYLKLKTGAK